jgi:hypothetical protein
MNWKILTYISLILITALLVKWYSDSNDYGETIIFSKDKKPVVTKSNDPLFGTETSKTEWKDGFWLGLLPNDDSFSSTTFFAVVPIGGILIVIGAFGIFLNHRQKKAKEQIDKFLYNRSEFNRQFRQD